MRKSKRKSTSKIEYERFWEAEKKELKVFMVWFIALSTAAILMAVIFMIRCKSEAVVMFEGKEYSADYVLPAHQ